MERNNPYNYDYLLSIGELKEIRGINGYYVSKQGQLFRELRNGVLKERHSKSKTFTFTVNFNCFSKHISVLVYETFIGEIPEGYTIYYKDGDRTNCCLDNLYIGKIETMGKRVELLRLKDNKKLNFEAMKDCYNYFIEEHNYIITYRGFVTWLRKNELSGYEVLHIDN